MAIQSKTDTIRIGLIGAGARGCAVTRNILQRADGRIALTSYFDPADRRDDVSKLPFAEAAEPAASFESIIDDPSINAVVVGTPNAYHRAPAEYAMRAGKLLFLEKPLAATLEDSRSILQTQRETGSPVLVGFVLRFVPFYQKLHELLQAGICGNIQTVHADEQMGVGLTADIYLRGWRADSSISGPLLLEKCCHDIDMLNWVLNRKCKTVAAFSDRTVFLPRADRPSRCRDCDDQECAYRAEQTRFARGEDLYNADLNDACVYNVDNSVADHTSLVARYEDGIHVTFSVTMGAPHTRRSIDIIGSKGRLVGSMDENRLAFYKVGAENKPEIIDLGKQLQGHGGGDGFIADMFLKLCENPKLTIDSNIEAGYESALVCFAADVAAKEQRTVDVGTLR